MRLIFSLAIIGSLFLVLLMRQESPKKPKVGGGGVPKVEAKLVLEQPEAKLGVPASTENISKRTWNSTTEDADGKSVTSFHGKWIHYLDAGGLWQKINTDFVDVGGHFEMNQAPFEAKAPKLATEAASFVSNNRWDVFDKKLIEDAPLTLNIQPQDVRPVAGQLIDGQIIYPGAYPILNADLIYRVSQGRAPRLEKLVRFNSNPNLITDANLNFKLTYDHDQQIKVNGSDWSSPRQKIKTKRAISVKQTGATGRRGIGLKEFKIWDSSVPKRREQAIEIELNPQIDGSIILTKIIPRVFLEAAAYPVYTDLISTFFPDPDPEITSVDGFLAARPAVPTTWQALRDQSTANFVISSIAVDNCFYVEADILNTDQWVNLSRGVFLFDTSSLEDNASISSSSLNFTSTQKVTTTDWPNATLTTSSPASNTNLVVADYAIANFGRNRLAPDFAQADWVAVGVNTFLLNAAGRNNISLTGVTKFGTLLSADFDNVAPAWTSQGISAAIINFAETAGTDKDPRLVVEYTLPPPPPIQMPGTLLFKNIILQAR